MAPAKRFPWWPVGLTAATLAVAAVALLRLPPTPPVSPTAPPQHGVNVIRLDSSDASAWAYDLTPLFLPTTLSSGQANLPASFRPDASGQLAAPEPPKLSFAADSVAGAAATGGLAVNFSEPLPPPTDVVAGLKLTERPDAPLTLGRTELGLQPLPARTGWVEVRAAGNGEVVWEGDLRETAPPPPGDWQPVELLGTVASAGLVGELVVTRSSGSDPVDKYIQQQLAEGVRVGARLSPGIYTFQVGP